MVSPEQFLKLPGAEAYSAASVIIGMILVGFAFGGTER